MAIMPRLQIPVKDAGTKNAMVAQGNRYELKHVSSLSHLVLCYLYEVNEIPRYRCYHWPFHATTSNVKFYEPIMLHNFCKS